MKRKKKALSIALAVSLASVSVIANAEGDYSIKRYPGEPEYRQKYKNINFQDIGGHWSKDAVFTMGSLGIIKGTGGGNYTPNSTLTKEEALLLIVRLMGLEEQAQTEGAKMAKERDTAGYDILDPHHYTVQGTISVAESAGIIDAKELANINPVTESTKAAIERDVQAELRQYGGRNLTAAQLKNIEEALREKVLRNYTWRQPISREVTAYWMGRAISPEGITGNSQQAVSTFRDWENISESYIPHIETVIQKGYIRGDNLNRFNPKGTLTRGEMAQMIYNAHEEKLIEQGYIVDSGKIVNIVFENGSDGGEAVKRRLIQIKNSDNETVEIYGQTSSQNNTAYDRGIMTYMDGYLTDHQRLREGQTVQYYIRPTGEAALAVELPNKEILLDGKLIATYDDMALVEGSDGNLYRYKMAAEVDFSVNGSWTEIEDLVPGMQGYYHILNNKIVKIEATVPEGGIGGGGNIAVGDYFDTGIVVSKSLGNKTLTVSRDGGTTQTYNLSAVPNVPVYSDGTKINLSDIRDGDSITVFFSDTDRSIAKIVLSPHKTRALKSIYKGSISYYNRNRDQIRLGDMSKIDDVSNWEKLSDEKTLQISDRADIYATDENGTTDILISRNAFEDYATYKEQQRKYIENALNQNRDVYLYTEIVNGREEITRIVLKGVGEYKYSGIVGSVSNGTFSLPSNQNLYYDNSSIVVKEGRLVSAATIKKGDTLTVYTHQGRNTAAVIFIEGVDVEEYPYTVYSTRIIGTNTIAQTIDVSGTASQKVKGKDVSHAPVETLNLPTDVTVKVFSETEKVNLTTDEFFTSYYKDYENARVKIVVDESGQILEMQIYREPLNRPELKDIRTAKVSSKDLSAGTVTITDVRTWTGTSWSTGVNSMTLDFSNAIVIVGGKASKLDRVPVGANVDVITDVNTGHTIIVR